MSSTLRFLLSPSTDSTSPSILYTLDSNRYLFSVPEGSTRATSQRKASASKISGVFLDSLDLNGSMGLPGLLMTLADSDRKEVEMYGPKGITYLMASMRGFTKRDSMKVAMQELEEGGEDEKLLPFYKDSNLNISFIELHSDDRRKEEVAGMDLDSPITKSSSSSTSSKRRKLSPSSSSCSVNSSPKAQVILEKSPPLSTIPYNSPNFRPSSLTGTISSKTWIKAVVEDMFNDKGRQTNTSQDSNSIKSKGKGKSEKTSTPAFRLDDPSSLPRTHRTITPAWVNHSLPLPDNTSPQSSLCFILQSHTQRGKFDFETAVSMGVSPGPNFTKLTKGENVRIKRPVDSNWEGMSFEERKKWVTKGGGGKEKKDGQAKKGEVQAKEMTNEMEEEELVEVEILSEQVVGKPRPGFITIHLNVPTLSHLLSLLAPTNLSKLKSLGTPQVIIHKAPPEVLRDLKYQDFIVNLSGIDPTSNSTLRPQTQHILTDISFSPNTLSFPSSSLSLLRLSKLDPQIFQVPPYTLTSQTSMDEDLGLKNFRNRLGVENFKAAGVDLMIRLGTPEDEDEVGVKIERFESESPDFMNEIGSKEIEDLARFKGRASLLKQDWGLKTDEKLEKNGKKDKGKRKDKGKTKVDSKEDFEDPTTKLRLQAAREKGWKEFLEMMKKVKEEIEVEEASRVEDQEGSGVVVHPLGTGSSHPSKYRNVSATLIETPQDGYLLLDVGESTYGQLCRKFGFEKTDQILKDLKIVFVSHIHADHHLGVARILKERKRVVETPGNQVDRSLYLLSNSFTRNYLRELNRIQDLGLEEKVKDIDSDFGEVEKRIKVNENGVILIENEWLDFKSGVAGSKSSDSSSTSNSQDSHCKPYNRVRTLARDYTKENYQNLLQSMNLDSISTCLVDHRAAHCYGLVFHHSAASTSISTSKSDWSIAYSGDTRPCQSLIEASQNVTLLIHEATLEDDQPEMADKKGHSTFGGAIQVAKESKAKYCLLTHFSQRYPKLARLSEMGGKDVEMKEANGDARDPPIIALAFDLMSLPLTSFWKMEKYRKAMEKLFDADEEAAVAGGESGDGSRKGKTETVREKKGGKNGSKDTEMKVVEAMANRSQNGIDSPTSKYPTIPTTFSQPSPGKSGIQRRNISKFGFKYVLLNLSSPTSLPKGFSPPELSISTFLSDSLIELHGLVGGAFGVDVLFVQATEPSREWEVTLKVDERHLETLISAISVCSSLEIGEKRLKVKTMNTGSALSGLRNQSGKWLEDLCRCDRGSS